MVVKLVNEIFLLQDLCEDTSNHGYRLATRIRERNSALQKEADWLAAMQQNGVEDDEPTRCPPGHTPPASCKEKDCVKCWREAARKAVEKVNAKDFGE